MKCPKIFRKNSGNLGFGLLELLIAVGVLGIVVMGFTRMKTNNFKAQKHLELDADRTDILRSISEAISCSKTVTINLANTVDLKAASACAAAPVAVTIYRKGTGNDVLISSDSNNPTVIGKWTVRAICVNVATQNLKKFWGIQIQASRLQPGASANSLYETDDAKFYPDPLTNKPASWGASKANLLPRDRLLCNGIIADDSPTSTTCTTTVCPYEDPYRVVVVGRINHTTNVGCDPSLAVGDAWVYPIGSPQPFNPANALGVADLQPSFKQAQTHYLGNAICPAGTFAVGGGGDCQAGNYGVMLTSRFEHVNGVPVGWQIDCCKPNAGAAYYEPAVFATCVKIKE